MIAAVGVLTSRLHFRGGQPYQLFMLFPIPPRERTGRGGRAGDKSGAADCKTRLLYYPHPHVVYSHLHPPYEGKATLLSFDRK